MELLSQQRNSASPTPSPTTPGSSVPSTTVDSSRLEELLRTQRWTDANIETFKLMTASARQEGRGWLDVVPCDVLLTIDRLWVKYSGGNMGFSVQKKIWQEVGSPTANNSQWERFGDLVGWRKNGQWLPYDELNPSLSSPKGLFPLVFCWGAPEQLVDECFLMSMIFGPKAFISLFSRATTCNL